MDIKKNRDIFKEALNSGCQTAAQLALYIRARSLANGIKISS